jgi:DNA polymerase sigma
MSILWRVKE